MPGDQSAALAEFARACKAAARAVSLYPGAHPAIGISLTRLVVGGPAALGPERDGARRPSHHPRDRRPRPGAPGCGHRRARGSAPRAPDRNAARRSRAPAPTTGARCCSCWRGRSRNCWPTAASTRHGRPPAAAGSSRSRKSTTPKSCASAAGRTARDWDRVLAYCLKGEAVELDDAVIDVAARGRRLLGQVRRAARPARTSAPKPKARASARASAALMHLLRATIRAVEAAQPRRGERRARHRGARHAPPVARDADRAAHEPPGGQARGRRDRQGRDRPHRRRDHRVHRRPVGGGRARRVRAAGPGVRGPRPGCRP